MKIFFFSCFVGLYVKKKEVCLMVGCTFMYIKKNNIGIVVKHIGKVIAHFDKEDNK